MRDYKQRTVSEIIQETPQDFFNKLKDIFNFTLDVCALPENAKCEKFYTPADNGLEQKWEGGVWCNPPYGKDIEAWVRKASYEIKQDYCNFIVMLIPARTDTKWFHNYVLPYSKIFYIKGRLKFGSNKGSAPFPSILAIYFKEFR